MWFRNLTDQPLTVVMGALRIIVEPQGIEEFPSDWAPIFAARGTLLAPCDETDDTDEGLATRVAHALGVPVEDVIVSGAPVKAKPAKKPSKKGR